MLPIGLNCSLGAAMAAQPILFPDSERFACQMCAGCCHNFDVTVNEDELRAFGDLDWAVTRPRFAGRELTVPRADGQLRLNRVDGGACIFLDDDNLCAIHKELGLEAKPTMCKQFPYRLTRSPDGLVATFDFACTSVVGNVGAPIEELEDDIRLRAEKWTASGRTIARAEADQPGHDQPVIDLGQRKFLQWADYLCLEEAVRCLLGEDQRS